MSRLPDAFAGPRGAGRPALVAYVMAGEPDGKRDVDYAREVLRHADVLEIGVPFSDPVADGPTIERAAVRALARGVKLDHSLSLARQLRAESRKPIVLMAYCNPLLKRGLDRFAREAADAGVDGLILPDVPLEEATPFERAFSGAGLDLVQLASPAASDERIGRLARATRGFLYVVSSFGVTGERDALPPESLDLVRRVASAAPGAPFAVGFGVSKPEHVRALHKAGAPGIVVGSAIVGRIERGETPEQVGAFVRSLRS